MVLTFIITLGFFWAGSEWYHRDNWPRPISEKHARLNDISAYKNIQRIILAQENYRETDWDDDGEKSYAQFLIQLWRTVTIHNEYIAVEFIEKELAFAMGQTLAIDGYYYEDLYKRESTDDRNSPLNYTKEWAIAGVPENHKKSGFLTFITDQTGQIFVKKIGYAPDYFPYNPNADGWTLVNSIEELKEYQRRK